MNKKKHSSTTTSTLDDDSRILAEAAKKRRNRTQHKISTPTRRSYTDREDIEKHRKNATPYNPKKLVNQDLLKKGWKGFRYVEGGDVYYRFQGNDDTMTPYPPYISTKDLDRSDVDQEALEKMEKLKLNYQKKISAMGTSGRKSTPQAPSNNPGIIDTPLNRKKKPLTREEADAKIRAKIRLDLPKKTDKFDPHGPGNAPKKSLSLSSSLHANTPDKEKVEELKKLPPSSGRTARKKAWVTPRKGWNTEEDFEKANQWAKENNKDPYQNTTHEASRYTRERGEVMRKLEKEKHRKRERERINAKDQKRLADEEGLQRYNAAEKAKDYEQKEKILGEACKRFFGDGSFLYRTFNITNNPEKMQDLINDIVKGLIEAEKMTPSRKDAVFHKLANEIFLYILENSKIKGDQFDELLNKIIMNNSLDAALVSLNNDYINSAKHMTTREKHDIIKYDGRLKPDKKARTNFVHLMGKLYTRERGKLDIVRKHLVEKNKANGNHNYLNRPTHNTKHKRAVIKKRDNDIYSQTREQQNSGYFMRNGKKVSGRLEGDMRSAATFDPKSLNTSQRNPIDSKFFIQGNYGQRYGNPVTLSRYFSYSGMIRSYEHNFYIPGDDTKYESLHQVRNLEHQTNERFGTIENDIWYSQKNDGLKENWVWKQSMEEEKKDHHQSWKEIKDGFKHTYIESKNPAEAFKAFVKGQENNPRYIIFKGITSALFRFTTTQQRNAFHYGFIDTKSGIKLGDYIMFECINDYHETSPNAFLALQPPRKQTPLMFFIHDKHLNPPKNATKDELQDWANKRSILSEYEYRGLFLNKLMDKDSQPLMEEIQSLTDFTTAGKFCEGPNSINKNHTELCYSTGEEDEEGNPIYKSNVKFPEEQFKAMSNEESGILAIQYSILENFITGTQKKIEDLEKTECISMGEPCFELILEAYDEIATFKTTTQQRLDDEMSLLTEYSVFLHQLLDLNLTGENKKQVNGEIVKVTSFSVTVNQKFMKLINGKELNTILKNLFNKNGEMLIEFKEIQLDEFQWVGIAEENKRREAIKHMEEEWEEQKIKFDGLMDKHFKEKWAEAASDLRKKIAERDNEISAILLEYNNASKQAHDEKAAEEAREEAALLEEARLAKEEEDRKEAARLAKEADEKAKEVARLKKEADEKAEREKEASRKKVLLATLRKWQETYEKEKREEERRVLLEEIRKNYNKAIEHNIKIRKEINDKLEELGQKAKELLETADPDIYTNMMDVNSKWGTQISTLKDAELNNGLKECMGVFTELLKDVNGLLTKYKESHLSSHATNIEEFKNKLEDKIRKCEGFIKEVQQFENLIKLNEYFGEDGEVVDSSLGDIVSAIQIIDVAIRPNDHERMTMDDMLEAPLNEDPVPDVIKPIILGLKGKLEKKEKEMKDVVAAKLTNINEQLTQKEKEMKDILKKYGYNNTADDKEQNAVVIENITQIIKLFGGLKHIMEEEENIEIEIRNIFEVKEEKIPDDESDEEKEERERMRVQKTNEEELEVIRKKKVDKEELEKKLELKKLELEKTQGLLKEQLNALRTSPEINNFENNLKEAFQTTTDIFNDVNKIKDEYEDIAKDHHEGEQPRLIEGKFKQFENKIGDGFLRKKQVIEFIKGILDKDLDNEGVKEDDIQKIINGGEKSLDNELVGVPDLLINITKFLLEEIIYKKALINNGNWFEATKMDNDRLEKEREEKERTIQKRIEKQEEERIEEEKQAKLKADAEAAALVEKKRLEKLAREKEEFQKQMDTASLELTQTNDLYKNLLSKHSKGRYSKETQDLNEQLMEMIFKSGLLHSDQTYQKEDKPGHRQGVEEWFDATGAGDKMKEDNITYEDKLKKYNEAMKETNEIFG